MSEGFLGIDHVPFNYRLRDARLRLGWSRRRLAAEAAVTPTSVGRYEALKKWPTPAMQERLATVLRDASDYLFPPEVGVALSGRVAHTTTSVLPMETLTLTAPEVRQLEAPDPFDEVAQSQLEEAVHGVLETLPRRDRYVLEQHFGLDGSEPRTLRDIGHDLNISLERVRQIERRGLNRLRSPARSRMLREFAE